MKCCEYGPWAARKIFDLAREELPWTNPLAYFAPPAVTTKKRLNHRRQQRADAKVRRIWGQRDGGRARHRWRRAGWRRDAGKWDGILRPVCLLWKVLSRCRRVNLLRLAAIETSQCDAYETAKSWQCDAAILSHRFVVTLWHSNKAIMTLEVFTVRRQYNITVWRGSKYQ